MKPATIADFDGYTPTWCPGCGDWGIGVAIKSALVKQGFSPSTVTIIFGIGCSGNMNDFLNAYAMHSLHGRSLPNGIGVKIAQHDRRVIAVVGDGDCYGEGGNHLIHAARGNHDLTVIVHDNGVYGLTTGQVAPTADKGFKSKSTPAGIIEVPVNPLALTISQGATFVAQAFAGDINHATDIIGQAVMHKGFSLVNILQPCVTFNRVNTYQYYLSKVYKLGSDYNPEDKELAIKKALESESEKFPLGILYRTKRPTFTDNLPQLTESTLQKKERFTKVESLLEEFI